MNVSRQNFHYTILRRVGSWWDVYLLFISVLTIDTFTTEFKCRNEYNSAD